MLSHASLDHYLAHLEALPFIKRATVTQGAFMNDTTKPSLRLRTLSGEQKAYVFQSKSHLTRDLTELLIHRASSRDAPSFIFAPAVGRELAERLDSEDINFVDAAGNCRVILGDSYMARIEGRRAASKGPRERALRAPSLQVLFALLARPTLISAPVRTISEWAGEVSPQTVSDVRHLLVAEEWVTSAKRHFHWSPAGKEQALDYLVVHYDVLARHLLLGRYRARPGHLTELEHSLAVRLKDRLWAFGGGAALMRNNGFYRGTRTIVYLEEDPPNVSGLLVPAEEGEVFLCRFPGKCAREDNGDIAPVLVYLDLMAEGEPRAREAAAELRPRLFQVDVR